MDDAAQGPEFRAGLPTRDVLLDELVRLRDSGESRLDVPSQFIGAECRVALYALVQGNNALARGELLGGLYYMRLIAEIAIRVRWIAGDGEDVGDLQGRPAADPETVRTRTRGMAKRDLAQLEAAYRSIHEAAGTAPELADELRTRAAAILDDPAPWDIGRMATSPSARKAYAAHRLCSSIIHPGVTLGRRGLMPRSRAEAMTDEAAYLCSAWADAALRALETLAEGS